MPRLNDQQRKKIIADYIETQNYLETARRNGVSDFTVKATVNKNKETSKKLEQKKIENTQTTLEYMQTQHETKKRILDKLLKGIEVKASDIDMFTNVKDLATAYGIILDKELKILEIQREKNAANDELSKVKELLTELKKEAER